MATSATSKLLVISGCSGGGKSTLIAELANRGHRVVVEPGREVVQQQQQCQGDGLPWVNPEKFLQLCLERATTAYESALATNEYVWFDRSIVDTLSALQGMKSGVIGDYNAHYAKYRYAETVFIAPPWPEIYVQDAERQHSLDSALKEYQRLQTCYPQQDYRLVEIPKLELATRTDFLEAQLQLLVPSSSENSK